MRILVIGANGQVGWDCCRVLTRAGQDVIGLTHKEIEVTDREQTEEAIVSRKPDVVINTAAFHQVDQCEREPERAYQVNVNGAASVARAAAQVGAVVVYLSTDYVFDGAKGAPYIEEDSPSPLNTYGSTKLAGEWHTRHATPRHFIIRTASVFGIHGPSGRQNIPDTFLAQATEHGVIRAIVDRVVSPTYSLELAEAIAALVASHRYGLYHVTSEGTCIWYEFALELVRLAKVKAEVVPVESRNFSTIARRPAYSVLENKRLNSLRLYRMSSWRNGLRRYLEEKEVR